MSSQIQGSVTTTINLNPNTTGGFLYSRTSSVSVAANELLTATNLIVPPGGLTLTLPASASGQTATITGSQLVGATGAQSMCIYDAINTFSAGQIVTTTGLQNNSGSLFDVTQGVIAFATPTQFGVPVA